MVDIDKCRITHYPADVLGKKAEPVKEINDNIKQLVEKMYELMRENRGVGFAAPQAGVSLRLFIISLDGSRENVKVFVNPAVTPYGNLDTIEEGCLSVPGVSAKIRRYKQAKVTATGLDGREFSEEAEGLYARALQHENDHLEGVTIVNRLGSAAKISNRKQLKKLQENASD
ncbi:MAG: peptide deformylase [Sedimentisphaerales bacterium]